MTPFHCASTGLRWLACPTSPAQIEAYWQVRGRLHDQGIALDLCLCHAGHAPPWAELAAPSRWRGVVLFQDGCAAQHLLVQARRRSVPVWVLAADDEVQPGLGAWPSGQSRI